MTILIADVSGHGIPAALIASMAKITFGEACKRYDAPAKILEYVNDILETNLTLGNYLTAFILVVGQDLNVRYSRAGHRSIMIQRKEGFQEQWETDGPLIGPLGGLATGDDFKFREKTAKLQPGDRVLMYTDGLIEAVNSDSEPFTENRLSASLSESAGMTGNEAKSHILQTFNDFTSIAPIDDDVTFAIIDVPAKMEKQPVRTAAQGSSF